METKYTKEWGSNKCGSTAKSKITNKKTKYLRLGYTKNPRKVEMAKCGAATTQKRGPICSTRLSIVDADELKDGFIDKGEIASSCKSRLFLQAARR